MRVSCFKIGFAAARFFFTKFKYRLFLLHDFKLKSPVYVPHKSNCDGLGKEFVKDKQSNNAILHNLKLTYFLEFFFQFVC